MLYYFRQVQKSPQSLHMKSQTSLLDVIAYNMTMLLTSR